MIQADLIARIPVNNVLGEGVIWDRQTAQFWWTDIEARRLYRYDPQRQQVSSQETPFRLASFALIENDERLLAAFDRGIALFELDSGRVDWLVGPSTGGDGIRFNDGRVDRNGYFCVGTMLETAAAPARSAALYRLKVNGALEQLIGGISISNGLAWSPNGRRMYHADSPTSTISVGEYASQGTARAARRRFAEVSPDASPDGASVDCQGRLWSALWGAGAVACFSETGEELFRLEVAAQQPTCVAFGGADLDQLFVTSASIGLDSGDSETQGAAFLYQVNTSGVADARAVQAYTGAL